MLSKVKFLKKWDTELPIPSRGRTCKHLLCYRSGAITATRQMVVGSHLKSILQIISVLKSQCADPVPH